MNLIDMELTQAAQNNNFLKQMIHDVYKDMRDEGVSIEESKRILKKEMIAYGANKKKTKKYIKQCVKKYA